MGDLNTGIQAVFVRRAAERSRLENGTIVALEPYRTALEDAIVQLVQQYDSMFGEKATFGIIPHASALDSLIGQIAGVLGTILTNYIETISADLKALTELELQQLPIVVNHQVSQAVNEKLAEAYEPWREVQEYIVKVAAGYRIISHRTGKNLGTFRSRAKAKKHLAHLARFREATEPLDPMILMEAPDDIPPSIPQAQGVFGPQLAEILAQPLGGARFANSFADLSTATLSQLRNTLTTAMTQGWSTDQTVRAVRGILNTNNWQAERIVRSEYTRVSNQATLLFIDQNPNLFRGVQWVATLDRRTCLQCGVLDGRVWTTPAEAPIPGQSTHPNCRCVLVPLVRSGLPLPPGSRATASGEVPATLSYREWFAQQEPAFQREVLGATRYRLYRRGRFRLTDFASLRGIRSVQSLLASAGRV